MMTGYAKNFPGGFTATPDESKAWIDMIVDVGGVSFVYRGRSIARATMDWRAAYPGYRVTVTEGKIPGGLPSNRYRRTETGFESLGPIFAR